MDFSSVEKTPRSGEARKDALQFLEVIFEGIEFLFGIPPYGIEVPPQESVDPVGRQETPDRLAFAIDWELEQASLRVAVTDLFLGDRPGNHVAIGCAVVEPHGAGEAPILPHGSVNGEAGVRQCPDDVPGWLHGPARRPEGNAPVIGFDGPQFGVEELLAAAQHRNLGIVRQLSQVQFRIMLMPVTIRMACRKIGRVQVQLNVMATLYHPSQLISDRFKSNRPSPSRAGSHRSG